MILLTIGIALFLGMHSFSMNQPQRLALVERLGARGFKLLYSVVSLIGLVLIIWGFASYRAAGMIAVWNPPTWTRHLAALLMLPALPLLFSAYASGFVRARLKHPMILAVKIWALAHLLANGDLGSIVLFGSFLVWAILAFRDMRRRPVDATKAFVPNPGQDAGAILGGLIAYGLMVGFAHQWLIGVGVFG